MEVKKGNHAGRTGSVMHQREENHRSGKRGELEGSSSSRMSSMYRMSGIRSCSSVPGIRGHERENHEKNMMYSLISPSIVPKRLHR
jgi:hypothetical protein